jgi:pantothenate synthetase
MRPASLEKSHDAERRNTLRARDAMMLYVPDRAHMHPKGTKMHKRATRIMTDAAIIGHFGRNATILLMNIKLFDVIFVLATHDSMLKAAPTIFR